MSIAAASRKGRPRNGDDPAPEELVLATALHHFATRGYDGVSVRDLNRALGVSHNLLHQRFGTKERLWYASVDWGFGGLIGELIRVDEEGNSFEQRLHAMIRAITLHAADQPDLLRLICTESARAGARLDYLTDVYIRPIHARLGPLYTDLAGAGRLRPVPVSAVFHLITFGCGAPFSSNALTMNLFGEEPLTPEGRAEHADAVAALIVGGLRLPDPTG
ncbi:TetR/AcrR family transcriptional regulator [Amycolatopsis sp. NPDC004378]